MAKKVKATQNTAAKVETKQPQQTSEELAFLLNQNYANIMQAQQNIMAINKELERRQLENLKPKD